MLLTFKKLRTHIRGIDIFVDRHSNPLNKPAMFRKTLVGGIFSSLFILFALITIIFGFFIYFLGNIEEIKTSVPTIIVDEKVVSENFTYTIKFYSYGSNCTSDNQYFIGLIEAELGLEYESKFTSCNCIQDDCIFQCKYSNFHLSLNGYINLKFDDILSYSSLISINISSSSIPNQLSEVNLFISPTNEFLVFRGANPSIFKLN